jgi:RNA-directed DNA polymerase
MSGDAHVRFRERLEVRFPRATRLVVGFEREDDARRFLDAMRARLEEFELTLHPAKTRLIEFGRHAAARRKQRGLGKPETFAFMGFTFICGKSRQGRFQLQRKTRSDRMRTKLREIKEELRRRMHWPIPAQGRWLRQVVTGHFAYFAVPTNGRALNAFLSDRPLEAYASAAQSAELSDR